MCTIVSAFLFGMVAWQSWHIIYFLLLSLLRIHLSIIVSFVYDTIRYDTIRQFNED